MLHLPVGEIYIRQNAHNSFLPILAELGVAGFICFVALLWTAGRGLWAASRAPDPAGSLGCARRGWRFLISALFGHPLLAPGVRVRVLDDRRGGRGLRAGAAAAAIPIAGRYSPPRQS